MAHILHLPGQKIGKGAARRRRVAAAALRMRQQRGRHPLRNVPIQAVLPQIRNCPIKHALSLRSSYSLLISVMLAKSWGVPSTLDGGTPLIASEVLARISPVLD
jgi:hypothetical protein